MFQSFREVPKNGVRVKRTNAWYYHQPRQRRQMQATTPVLSSCDRSTVRSVLLLGCLPSRNRRYKDAALVFAVHAGSANTAGPEAQGGHDHDHEGASRPRVVRALAESTWAQPRRRAATVHGRSRQHAECYRATATTVFYLFIA
jgi:hypothetical protein